MPHRQYAGRIGPVQRALSRRSMLVAFFGATFGSLSGAGPVASGRLERLIDPVTLRLDDGRIIRIPDLLTEDRDGHDSRSSSDWGAHARQAVHEFCGTRNLIITPESPEYDRHGRIRADIYVMGADHGSLSSFLIRQGLARVFPEPEAAEARIQRLLSIENGARMAAKGAWSDGSFAVQSADTLAQNPRGDRFEIVSGTVHKISHIGSRHHLEFGQDWRDDFTVGLNSTFLAALRRAGSSSAQFAGKRLEVRGWVRIWNGPFMELDRLDQLARLSG